MRIAVAFTVVAALSAPLAHAQAPSPAKPAQTPQAAKPAEKPAPAPAAPAPDKTPAPAAGYSYRAEGRRDPFQSLIGTGSEAEATSRRGEGPAGMALGEVSVRGIMQSRGALVAMIQGPDTKTYIVHPGDKLLDGTIKTITPQGLIV